MPVFTGWRLLLPDASYASAIAQAGGRREPDDCKLKRLQADTLNIRHESAATIQPRRFGGELMQH
ncbi:MAG: hypothetical protein ABIQ97_01615 [Lysobacteraceae bacterium]